LSDPKPVEFAISCGIYLRGEDLDPDVITATLGIEPTSATKRGDVRHTSSGRQIVARLGLWKYIVYADAAKFEPTFEEVLSIFSAVKIDLKSLPGVTDAVFDIFGTGYRTASSDAGYFSVSAEQIQRLSELNLSLDTHISIFDEPSHPLTPP